MASERGFGRGVALPLVLGSIVLGAALIGRYGPSPAVVGAASPGPAQPTDATILIPDIPMPDGVYAISTNGVALGTGQVDDMEGRARAAFPNAVGDTPLVRFLDVRADRGDFAPEGPQWIVLSSDASVPVFGPVGAGEFDVVATFAWVFLDDAGRPLHAMYASYLDEAAVPVLPLR